MAFDLFLIISLISLLRTAVITPLLFFFPRLSHYAFWTHAPLIRHCALFEYYLWPIRQYLITPLLFFIVILKFYQNKMPPFLFLISLPIIILLFLINKKHRILSYLKAATWLKDYPKLHPESFFRSYHAQLAYGVSHRPTSEIFADTNPTSADFNRGKKTKKSLMPLFLLIPDTICLAYLCLTTLKILGNNFTEEIFDHAASMWGKRAIWHTKAKFNVTGLEKLQNLQGKNIFIFNHKSSMDFIIGFFALSGIKMASRAVRLRFIVAKDHFKDNPIIYHFLGVGKIIEAVHMAFIERKTKKKGFENLAEAAHTLVAKDIDLAIYPQGTRAKPTFQRDGSRLDAGYYTTLSQRDIESPLGHLRKGSAHLIVETLKSLRDHPDRGPLNIIFVGLNGTGTILPAKHFYFQTQTEVAVTIGEIVSFTPHILIQNQETLFQQFHALIQEGLRDALGLHDALAQRFLTDLKLHFTLEVDRIEHIAQALYLCDQRGEAVFALIDRIYSLPIDKWNGYLSELMQILLTRPQSSRLKELCHEVSLEILK